MFDAGIVIGLNTATDKWEAHSAVNGSKGMYVLVEDAENMHAAMSHLRFVLATLRNMDNVESLLIESRLHVEGEGNGEVVES